MRKVKKSWLENSKIRQRKAQGRKFGRGVWGGVEVRLAGWPARKAVVGKKKVLAGRWRWLSSAWEDGEFGWTQQGKRNPNNAREDRGAVANP